MILRFGSSSRISGILSLSLSTKITFSIVTPAAIVLPETNNVKKERHSWIRLIFIFSSPLPIMKRYIHDTTYTKKQKIKNNMIPITVCLRFGKFDNSILDNVRNAISLKSCNNFISNRQLLPRKDLLNHESSSSYLSAHLM